MNSEYQNTFQQESFWYKIIIIQKTFNLSLT